MKTIYILALLISFPFMSVGAEARDALVAEHMVLESRYDNGYPEARYHEVLDLFLEIYRPIIAERGGTFHIKRDWGDGAVNAWAERNGTRYIVEVPGGMSRYHLINEEAFVLTVCHEIGHLLGGMPHYRTISFEGQSDYYGAMKCMRRVLPYLAPWDSSLKASDEVRAHCAIIWERSDEMRVCERTLIGALSLTSYFAELERSVNPRFETPSPVIVRQSVRAHPGAQCRLDTFWAGALCPASMSVDFDYNDERIGACQALYARPNCWFRSELEFLRRRPF